MNPIRHIRTKVLGVNQSELARIADTNQGTVSRWETGELEPSLSEMARIRDEARSRGIPWDDRWFFTSPPAEKPPAEASAP